MARQKVSVVGTRKLPQVMHIVSPLPGYDEGARAPRFVASVSR
jgi:hypothetical protein